MSDLTDRAAGSIFVANFNSVVNGAPITLAGSPTVVAYKNSLVPSSAGITLTVDYDGITGLHHVEVDTSADGAFYDAGNDFSLVLTAGTVGGQSVAGMEVGAFSIGLLASAAALALVKNSTDALPSDPADASVIAGLIAALDAKVDAVAVDTGTDLPTLIAALPTNTEIATALAAADDAMLALVALVKAKTDLIPTDPADASDIASAFSTVNAALTTIASYLDTEITAIKERTDLIPGAPAAVGDMPTAVQNADALLDRANAIEAALTVRQALRLMAAVLAGKVSGAGTDTETFRSAIADDADRVVATVDEDGNRSDIITDLD